MVDVGDVSASSIAEWKQQDWHQVVLMLDQATDTERIVKACQLIKSAKLEIEYFWEVARCPQLADTHPEWMASLQGHDEWRRLYPEFPAEKPGEVVKTYPWVPICYQESFDSQLDRLKQRLKDLPTPKRVWLHDLQAAPSACGCGHPLCRWTGDYGPIHTAQPYQGSAAADFIDRLTLQLKEIEFIPIWVTECEKADEHEACGGVGCYEGICWNAWTKQLSAIEAQSPVLGVSCFYKAHQRDLPRYGSTAGWIKEAISFFETVPAQKKSSPVAAGRLVAVLQGWSMAPEQVESQISIARAANVRGILLMKAELDQSWQPRIHRWRPK